MNAKLMIDLAKCRLQEESGVQCSYKHHPENKGFDSLLEMIRFALICRRCEGAPCIKACPRGALEKINTKSNDAGIGLFDLFLKIIRVFFFDDPADAGVLIA